MAETTQNQTAATAAAPGTKPAGGAAKPSTVANGSGAPVNLRELDLEASLDAELGGGRIEQPDPELDADLPKPKAKKDKQENQKPKDKKTETETETESDDDKALRSALGEEESEEEEEEDSEASGEDDEEHEEENEDEGPTDEELEAAMPENSDEIDPENPPKGLEKVPKPVWKRIVKQSAKIRELTNQLAEGPVELKPSAENPLSDVNDIETLDERVAKARDDRDWVEENPQGGSRTVNGKTIEVSEEDAAKMRRESKRIIDSDATTRQRLTFREQTKPWEKAQAVTPAMFEKGTQEHTFMVNVLRQCPQITQQLPDWEYFLATAARGMRQVIEERSGKAKYVRFEVGPDGKLLPLKSKPKTSAGGGPAKAGAETAKPKPTTKTPPATPSSQRPPITRRPNGGAAKPAVRMPAGDSDLAAMLANELG